MISSLGKLTDNFSITLKPLRPPVE